MKKTKLTVALLLVVCLVGALALAACGSTQYTVIWQNGKNYSITDESGNALNGEQKVDEGTTLKFKVVPANSLTTVTKVTAGDETLTATNGVYSVTVNADVKIAALATTLNNDVQSIAITTQPDTTEYNVGESFNKEGMVVTATLRDGTTKTVTDYQIVYQTVGASAFVAGDTKVTISYTDSFSVTKTADVAITVANVQLTGITKSGALTKTEYAEGSTLDNIDGLTVTANYDNGISRELEFADLTVVYATADATSFTLGDTKVTLKYGEYTLDIDVTVRAWQAFDNESIRVEMLMDGGKPFLKVTGDVVDAETVAFAFGSNGTNLGKTNGTIVDGKFSVSASLNTLFIIGKTDTWYDCKLFYGTDATAYIDLNKDSCVDYNTQLYYQGKHANFADWQGALKVNFVKYEIRNAVASVAQDDAAINLTVSGELGTAKTLELVIGGVKAADAILDTNAYTFTVTADLVAFVAANSGDILPNTVYDVKLGTNAIDALASDVEIELGDYKYVSVNNGGKLAVKVVPVQGFDTEAEIALNTTSGAPELTVVGKTEATAVNVRIGAIVEEALVEDGTYLAVVNLKDLLIVGNKYNVEISEDGGAYVTLTAAEVEYTGTASYRLTAKPRSDIYAKNLYGFTDNDGKLAVSYTQSAYMDSNDSLVAHIMGIGYQNGRFAFVYENNKNAWGALKKGEWLWFADAVDYGTNAKLRIAPKDEDAAKFTYGSWTIGYTTGELNDMDHDVFLAYDGTQTDFVSVDGVLGFEVVGGHINAVKKVSDYTAQISISQHRDGSVGVTVFGQFAPALAVTEGYGVHAWYNASIDFEGEIDAEGNFTYNYTFTEPKAGTMYLHMMNAGDEVNLKGTIQEGYDASQTIDGFTYTINRNESNGELTIVITEATA
ncbi:MAG: bacterial Ig-like domain-containing protein [Corallococcus sp.]|nr:bacterial Ig-like domain-containing protein [Corallococcus sp.]MCM1360137.1 bacterial Ig-like domain-containing protein [Corallococcus sp.]MCM1395475.1 bacterial Ig-like domain-containing protein [Corallococcus sp.]